MTRALLGAAIGCSAVLGYGVLTREPSSARRYRAGRRVPRSSGLLRRGRILTDVGVDAMSSCSWCACFRPDYLGQALAGVDAGPACGAASRSVGRTGASATRSRRSAPGLVWRVRRDLDVLALEHGRVLPLLERDAEARGDRASRTPSSANRFLLWGTAPCSRRSLLTASISYAYVVRLRRPLRSPPAVRIATAIAGIGSVRCSLCAAFLPPACTHAPHRALLHSRRRGGLPVSRGHNLVPSQRSGSGGRREALLVEGLVAPRLVGCPGRGPPARGRRAARARRRARCSRARDTRSGRRRGRHRADAFERGASVPAQRCSIFRSATAGVIAREHAAHERRGARLGPRRSHGHAAEPVGVGRVAAAAEQSARRRARGVGDAVEGS